MPVSVLHRRLPRKVHPAPVDANRPAQARALADPVVDRFAVRFGDVKLLLPGPFVSLPHPMCR